MTRTPITDHELRLVIERARCAYQNALHFALRGLRLASHDSQVEAEEALDAIVAELVARGL